MEGAIIDPTLALDELTGVFEAEDSPGLKVNNSVYYQIYLADLLSTRIV